MAKIRTCELKQNGKRKKFDVCYSNTEGLFYVKLPDAITKLIHKRPFAESPEKAEVLGQTIIDAFEEANNTRRKVIIVETAKKSRRHGYNGMQLDPVGVELSFLVVDEIQDSTDGSKNYVNPENGRAVWFAPDAFTAIEWTAEREAYFTQFREMLETAEARLKSFLKECGDRPELIDGRALPALMEGSR